MKYRVETTPRFEKEFRKLDRYTQRMLKAWIDKTSWTAPTHAPTARA